MRGQWQGAVCELPMPAFPTGIMRGRFGADGALYACGLFAWAGNAIAPGGFYRIRRTATPAYLPITVHAARGVFSMKFSEALDPASVTQDNFAMKVWTIKRTANYGSNHYNEHPIEIVAARLEVDGRTIALSLPELSPTRCYELKVNVRGAGGEVVKRSLHGTIHELAEK